MKIKFLIILCFSMLIFKGILAQSVKKIVLDKDDERSGYYLAVEPQQEDTIKGVLLLFSGFGQYPESALPETKLHNVASANNILTIFFAGGDKLYVDSITLFKTNRLIQDVLTRYKIAKDKFVLGGYSAGGMLAMRYVELCNEFPNKFAIQPQGIFTVDAPLDIFTIYEQLEQSVRDNLAPLAVEEANRAIGFIKKDFGVPRENVKVYSKLTAFSMNKDYSENEKFLKNTAVRTYHDVDIAWRIINRNQTVHLSNYEVSAELINRLVLMGNKRAEFMQTFKTGYRANGQRHPHSWSIVDEVDLIQWMKKLLEE